MNYTSNSLPEAYIAVGKNKNRLKIYNGKDVFLKDGEEFQIELFNPTTKTVGAKIFVNGNSISNSLLVIKPGERSYLERYLDDDKKFLFDTYVVENSKVVKDAIRNNGIIRVEFYSEKVPSYFVVNYPTYPTYPTFTTISPPTYYYGGPYYGTTGTSIVNCCSTTTNLPTATGMSATSDSFNLSDCTLTGTGTSTSASFFVGDTANTASFSANASQMETGRVEKGSHSDQSFSNYYGDFETYYFTSKEYKLLPESSKPIEMKDIRQYCPGCRTRIKKSSWKFCPSCGETLG